MSLPSAPVLLYSFHRGWVALLIAVVFGSAAVSAQPLTAALCPAGSPFNMNTTFSTFFPGMAGIPLLRRTIDTTAAGYPNAKCNNDSSAFMYIRPANAAYGGNPIVNPSSKWVIFHVLVHYCSSDNWIGSADKASIVTTTGVAYDIKFQGEAIVSAVFGTLQTGATGADFGPAVRTSTIRWARRVT